MSDVKDVHVLLDALDSADTSSGSRRRELMDRLVGLNSRSASVERSLLAAIRLSEVTDKASFLQVIEEIISVLVGSEQYILYRFDEASDLFTAVAALGFDASGIQIVTAEVVRKHSRDLLKRSGLLLCPGQGLVPLIFGSDVVGLIYIGELLPQKEQYSFDDPELLEGVSRMAGELLCEYFPKESATWN